MPPRIYEITDNILLLKSLLTEEVKVNNTNDDIRLKPDLNNNKTNKFSEKSFLHYIRFYRIILGSIRR